MKRSSVKRGLLTSLAALLMLSMLGCDEALLIETEDESSSDEAVFPHLSTNATLQVDQQCTFRDTGQGNRLNHPPNGQTFTAGQNNLAGFAVKAYDADYSNIPVELWDWENRTKLGGPYHAFFAMRRNAARTYELATPVPLQIGHKYALLVYGPVPQTFTHYTNGLAYCPGGSFVVNGFEVDPNIYPGWDTWFITYYDPDFQSDVEGPIVTNVETPPVLIGDDSFVRATVDDSQTGDATISWAGVRVDDAPDYFELSPSDGAFDSSTEQVEGSAGVFATPGVHELCVEGKDAHDNLGPASCSYLVVYDPDGGFVTGGGWFNSVPEFCPSFCAGAAGKAMFGFVSKYKKGASAPTGHTQFKFETGNLEFHSDSYDWLVIAGHKAMYKGEGSVNGRGNYGFHISAIDGDLTPSTDTDLFRIRIWDRESEELIYDNQVGDRSEHADPSTAIGGGSIKIHKPNT